MRKTHAVILASTLLLVGALGGAAYQARAQAGARAIGLSITGQGPLVLDDTGRIFNVPLNAHVATIPGAVAVSGSAQGDMWVVCGNGNIYNTYANSGARTYNFSYVGNVFSSAPTLTTPQSWGQVKERYR